MNDSEDDLLIPLSIVLILCIVFESISLVLNELDMVIGVRFVTLLLMFITLALRRKIVNTHIMHRNYKSIKAYYSSAPVISFLGLVLHIITLSRRINMSYYFIVILLPVSFIMLIDEYEQFHSLRDTQDIFCALHKRLKLIEDEEKHRNVALVVVNELPLTLCQRFYRSVVSISTNTCIKALNLRKSNETCNIV